MNQQRILEIAMRQSAIDCSCDAADFLSTQNKAVISSPHPQARKYLELPFFCQLVSYGKNIVASVREDLMPTVRDYMDKYPVYHCFETPNLHVLNDALQTYQQRICFMAEYFLPDVEQLQQLSCPFEMRLLAPEDFSELYRPEWSNALCEKRKHLDVLGVGAYHHDKLVGLAGCSADCDMMWQIGIDVLPEYRRSGIASALTSRLCLEILERERVPFYCAAWSNLASVRTAIRAGFRPAWIEMTAKPAKLVDEMNR